MLIVQVVHAHPLVGTTAFWMTRPIPPRALLNAKMGFFGGVMIGAPVIADLALMATYDVPWVDIARVSAQTALLWTAWTSVIMAAAALTANLAKFALLIGGAMISFAAVIALLTAMLFYRLETLPPLSSGVDVPVPNSGLVGLLLVLIAALVFFLVQYQTRRRVVSAFVGVAGIVVAQLVGSAWPWPVLAPIVAMPGWSANPAMLNLTASANSVAVERSFYRKPAPGLEACASGDSLARPRAWLDREHGYPPRKGGDGRKARIGQRPAGTDRQVCRLRLTANHRRKQK